MKQDNLMLLAQVYMMSISRHCAPNVFILDQLPVMVQSSIWRKGYWMSVCS